MRQRPSCPSPDLGKTFTPCLECVTARCSKSTVASEIQACKVGIGRCGNFGIKLIGQNGSPQARPRMLRQNIERTGAQGGVSCAFSATASMATRHSNTSRIGRHKHRFRGARVEPVIGTTDPLQSRESRWGAPRDHRIEASPQSTPRSREDGATTAGCRQPSRSSTRAVARHRANRGTGQWRDYRRSRARAPEKKFRLTAGVDEHQRGLVRLDMRINLSAHDAPGNRPTANALPCRASSRLAVLSAAHHLIGAKASPLRRLRNQITAKLVGLSHCGRKSDGGELRRQRKQPCEAERQQVPAFRNHQRMQFIEDNAPERAEQVR